ncbi:hypothetical protein F5Y17DRAFT_4489 [Xylariaceae sp. FL0594]|nr:hypothetical protein F5Y17DRAFT_4489 [Xylariaceae sp. FL0594]
MPPRKRALRDVEADVETTQQPSPESDLLRRIRNSWQFANLFQWIYLFGRVVKIDDSFDIEDLEAECLKRQSTLLVDIGLALLKFVSSHRGLTHDLFDEYTRRQYVAKSPDRNPFGTDESPAKFNEFDPLLKIRVLQQLTQWLMLHPKRIREKMDEQKPSDQTEWRIEPAGWDSDDRTYYILDDNRLYRLTPAPVPAPPALKPKKNTKKAKAAARAAKRRRTSRSTAQARNEDGDDDDDDLGSDHEDAPEPEDDGLGGAKWECVGVGLDDIRNFLSTIRKTRDENEKVLRNTIEEHLLPMLEKQEESRKRKALQREKELINLEKLAHAKRSSRIASKTEQQRLQQQAREAEEKRLQEEKAARKEEQKRLKAEKEHEMRAKSREKRLKEREARRLQYEEELGQLSEDSKKLAGNNRLSERRVKVKIEKSKRVLQELEDESDDWIFDCICGVYGQVDDGTHSVACERCNVWQHSKCVGISEAEADRDDFHFICRSCRRQQPNDDKQPVIKLKLSRPDISSAPSSAAGPSSTRTAQVEGRSQLSPVSRPSELPPIPVKPVGHGQVLPPPASPYINGDGTHAFSSPHPALSPPEQSPNKSRVYSTLFNPSSPQDGKQSPASQHKLPQKGLFPPPSRSGPQALPNTLPASVAAATAAPPMTSVAAKTDSPLKKPVATADEHLTITSPPRVASAIIPAPVQTPSANARQARSLHSTPQLDNTTIRPGDSTPSLPPSRNGISPLKRSPPPSQKTSRGINSSPTPAVLPPTTTLSPSPSKQISTPPIKPSDHARPLSRPSSSFGSDI